MLHRTKVLAVLLSLGAICLAIDVVVAAEPAPSGSTTSKPKATARPATAASTSTEKDAFAYAFQFASAIVSDRKDMGMAQESVVRGLIDADQIDRAIEYSNSVDGWRRGVLLADLAGILADAGRANEARPLIARAEQVRAVTEGWQNPRIAAHVAAARARLGENAAAERAAAELAKADDQYNGRATFMRVSALAKEGKFEEAFEAVKPLEASIDLEETWMRTTAYLEIAKAAAKDPALRKRAVDQAVASANQVPGFARVELLLETVDALRGYGDVKRTQETIEAADAFVLTLADTLPLKAPMMSNVARAWAKAGRADRANELLTRAEKIVDAAMVIERPAVVAAIGQGYVAVGNDDQARALFERALDMTGMLKNSRPRALAAAAVCRSLGSAGIPIDERLRLRLNALYDGLGDPW